MIRRSGAVPLVENIDFLLRVIDQLTDKSIRVRKAEVQIEGRFHAGLCPQRVNVEILVHDIRVNQALRDTPIAVTLDAVAARILFLHFPEYRAVGFIEPLIALPSCGFRENLIVRRVEETLFKPARGAPRVKGQRDLLKIPVRHLASNGHIQFVEVVLVGHLVALLKPDPAQISLRH